MNFSAPILCSQWICTLCKHPNCITKCLTCEVKKEVGEKKWILSEVLPQVSAEVLPQVPSTSVVSSQGSVEFLRVSAPVETISRPSDIVTSVPVSPPVSRNIVNQNDLARELANIGHNIEQEESHQCPLCPSLKPYKKSGFLENHKFIVHGDTTVKGVFLISVRFVRDNTIKTLYVKDSHKSRYIFDQMGKHCKISSCVFNDRSLSGSEVFKDLKMKNGDEILLYEVEYASGERESSEPAPKRRRTMSATSSTATDPSPAMDPSTSTSVAVAGNSDETIEI